MSDYPTQRAVSFWVGRLDNLGNYKLVASWKWADMSTITRFPPLASASTMRTRR